MTSAGASLWTADSFVLLDDNRAGGHARGALLFRGPRGAIEAHHPHEVAPALAALEAARRDGLHAAGFFAYELGYCLEPRLVPLLPAERSMPLLSFGLFDAPAPLAPDAVDDFLKAQGASADYRIGEIRPAWTEKEYGARFHTVQTLIRAGDVYQINLTFPQHFRLDGHPASLFAALRRTARAGHAAYLALKDLSVLSLSPELFVRSDGVRIETRPMKGTAKRGPGAEADDELRRGLRGDPKNRAENLMIVDLLRNDLGRVAKTGSVGVEDLFAVETYPTLHQMVSTVRASLRPALSLAGLLTALFPSGSITGAPKIRAMEIIRALEEVPRGLYCGAIGHIAPGALSLNVAIRTITIDAAGEAQLAVGSGLVADSDLAAEYAECLLKGRFAAEDATPFALIESFRWTADEGYALHAEHLARLARSSAYFGFVFDEAEIRRRLDDAARRFDGARRVRLTLAENGAVTLTDTPLPAPAAEPVAALLSARTVESSNPFLYHKTTRRSFFEAELARLAASGAGEVLFVNERGELTEGSRTNLFLERDGVLLTPPVQCGLLAGTLRARLLATGEAREAVLHPADLEKGTLFLGNGVRGLFRARYGGAEPRA